ncbi:hypothetical protein MMC34_007445 [Xylographa carneopallida]|nr:hypothetical protein [Xylographa carneopallida]
MDVRSTTPTLSSLQIPNTQQASYKRHSRRSHPNLHHLSVTPLTPAFRLPPTKDLTSPPRHHPTSYLFPSSLPQTPSLLSRSPSRTRLPRSSKSSFALSDLSGALTPLTYTKTPPLRSRTRSVAPALDSDHTASWLLQTGALLMSAAAEAKGQAWLAARSSSTSLRDLDAQPYPGLGGDVAYRADDEFSPVSTRYSRPGSRRASARGSRRASGVGETMGLEGKGEGGEDGGYFGGDVDFVDEDEEVEEDEEGEMRRVVWGRVGGWVDWVVGWMDWRVDGEEEEEREEGVGGEVGEEVGEEDVEKMDGRRRGRDDGHRIVMPRKEDLGKLEVPPPEGEGGWKDAVWLLRVAKKVLI